MTRAKPMSIVHIASGDLWAGAEVQLFTLTCALNKLTDTTIHVLLLNHGELEQKLLKNNIKVTVFDESTLNSLQIMLQLNRYIKKLQPDLIHTHRIKENIIGSIVALFNHTPSIRTAHGAAEHKVAWYQAARRLRLFLDWYCGRFIQKQIIAVSTDLAVRLSALYPANKITTIENGIDVASLAQNHAQVINEHTIADTNHYKVGIAGRLVPVKRVDLFLQTAALLIRQHPERDISFHIYGDGPLQNTLTSLNQKLNTEKKVHFEGHSNAMQKQLAELDILLITSDHEGMPMVLLEAMALHTPVIAHAVGGIPDLLDHGSCGILIKEQQASAYADAISRLLDDTDNRLLLAKKAFTRVDNDYSSEKNARAYHTTYSRLVYTTG